MTIPTLDDRFAALRDAGYAYSDQHDARLRWPELEVERLREQAEQLERSAGRDVEMLGDQLERLEGRLLEKIDGKPRPHCPDPEPDEELED